MYETMRKQLWQVDIARVFDYANGVRVEEFYQSRFCLIECRSDELQVA
jgi:hypothetical protein